MTSSRKISSVLIANRGEIACRIVRTCRAIGISTVAVYSDADAHAMHVRLADEAAHIGPPAPRESYLRIDRLIDAAKVHGCDAVHPGYGFLAENADFAQAVSDAGLVFIGPPAHVIRLMGSKTAAREAAVKAGVPVAPAAEMKHGGAETQSDQKISASLRLRVQDIGYPVLVKAIAGGGGKGMRLVRGEEELLDAIAAAQREAESAFGDGRVYLEKLIEQPRHVEVQVFGDAHGNAIHLGERECSIQRRHQKLIEETPSPFLDDALRARMCDAAVSLAQSVGYVNAGTIEFIVDPQRNFYFLEMNTRLQVEHPVTEMITGLDLVRMQIEVASGSPLPKGEGLGVREGYALECRVLAEDPARSFIPSVGRLTRVIEPRDARVDGGFATGDEVTPYYDSLLAKVITHGATRDEAIRKMQSALDEFVIDGVTTNIAFLRDVISHPAFARGETTTDFIERHMAGWTGTTTVDRRQTMSTSPVMSHESFDFNPWHQRNRFRVGEGNADRGTGRPSSIVRRPASPIENPQSKIENWIAAPMPGLIREVRTNAGDDVKRGATLVVMEAMKLEMSLSAPRDGRVKAVTCAVGDVVQLGQILVELAPL